MKGGESKVKIPNSMFDIQRFPGTTPAKCIHSRSLLKDCKKDYDIVADALCLSPFLLIGTHNLDVAFSHDPEASKFKSSILMEVL